MNSASQPNFNDYTSAYDGRKPPQQFEHNALQNSPIENTQQGAVEEAKGYGPLILVIFTFFALVMSFLPMVTGRGRGTFGVLLFLPFIIAIAMGIASQVSRRRGIMTATGVVGLITGILNVITSLLGLLLAMGSDDAMFIDWLLPLVAAIGIIVGAVLTLRQRPAYKPAPAYLAADLRQFEQFQQFERFQQFQQFQNSQRLNQDAQLSMQNHKPYQADASVPQIKDGAEQFASGMKGFYDHKVAPAANDAFEVAKSSARQMQGKSSEGRTFFYGPIILTGAGVLGLISLFLPIAHAFGSSINYFSELVHNEGMFLLIFMLAVISLGITAIMTSSRGVRIAAGVVGLIGGLFGVIDGVGSISGLSDTGVSIGIGLIFLTIASIAMIVGAVITLMQLRNPQVGSGAQPPAGPAQGQYPTGPVQGQSPVDPTQRG
ncbi:hypothetical protein [uncultured Actinomyces sp.]|uniref:hypothetical protein n=1 Tax=uncultured Actinomyces sp. TaxID=249061 RepID=UPI00288B981E|nr:hypothetical protein [uncultured Actinomyces sp.]